jgi:hypothetical protein
LRAKVGFWFIRGLGEERILAIFDLFYGLSHKENEIFE